MVRTAQQTLDEAIGANQETMIALNRTEVLVNESEEMGRIIGGSLATQREALDRTEEMLDTMPSQFSRARKEMITIVRRMFRDKVFMVLCCAVLGLSVAAVIIMIKRRTDEANSSPSPPSGGDTTVVVVQNSSSVYHLRE